MASEQALLISPFVSFLGNGPQQQARGPHKSMAQFLVDDTQCDRLAAVLHVSERSSFLFHCSRCLWRRSQQEEVCLV